MLCCEVCSSSAASSTLVRCSNCANGCQEACHTFCLPGPSYGFSSLSTTFTCLKCIRHHQQQQQELQRTHLQQQGPHPPHGCEILQQHSGANAPMQLPSVSQQQQQQPARMRQTAQGACQSVQGPPSLAAVNWTQLPSEVLTQILQHVPVQPRFSSCALVNPAWAAAATAAPMSSLSLTKETPAALLASWKQLVAKCNLQLTGLELGIERPDWYLSLQYQVKELAAVNLRSLKLSAVQLVLAATPEQLQAAGAYFADQHPSSSGGGSSSSGGDSEASGDNVAAAAAAAGAAAVDRAPGVPVDALSSLTQLHMLDVTLRCTRDSRAVLAALMQLTGLRHLRLRNIGVVCGKYRSDVFVPETYLGSLTRLTHLDITSGGLLPPKTPLALQQLGTLSTLKHLKLDVSASESSGSLAWLMGLTQLTDLTLAGFHRCSIPTPGFAALPKLRHLSLRNCSADPAVFAAATGLQHLGFENYGLAVAAGVDDNSELGDVMDGSDDDTDSVLDTDDEAATELRNAQVQQLRQSRQAAFFEWLQLQPLTSLSVRASKGLCSSRPFPVRGCAAMVASSCLQKLTCSWHEFEFPVQAQCSKLTTLVILGHPQYGPGPTLGWASKVQQLVQCCPALCELCLAGGGFGWLDLQLLLPLTALTRLSFGGFVDRQVPQLLLLTQLRALSLPAAGAGDAAAEALSGLRRLQKLYVHSKGFSRWMPCRPYKVVSLQQNITVRTPVWQQLLQRCEQARQRRQAGLKREAKRLL